MYTLLSSNPDISEEEETSVCAGSSSSKEDDWDAAQTILNMLLKNPQDFELKSKLSGVRGNRVCTLDKNIVPVESAKADDNGSYIYIREIPRNSIIRTSKMYLGVAS